MPQVLTPTAPCRFCISRLRQSVAEASRFTDDELLGIINDGYKSAARRANVFEALAVVTFTTGSQEALLPTDHSLTLAVYLNGTQLDPIDYRRSADKVDATYYQFGTTIGLGLGPVQVDTDALMFYARIPADLDFDDDPEWGMEWNYLLRHYAAWRCILASGGAQTIRKAVLQRSAFENGVRALYQSRRKGKRGGSQRARTTTEGQPAVAS